MVTHERDWDCDGAIRMIGETTIKRYRELKETHPDCKQCDCFFAFNKEQFSEGIKSIRQLKEGEKLINAGSGLFGTRDGLDKFFAFYDGITSLIKEECDPQEVYFYEYNNHESMISWDGDAEAIKLVIAYWGEDTARNIKRYSAFKDIDDIVKED